MAIYFTCQCARFSASAFATAAKCARAYSYPIAISADTSHYTCTFSFQTAIRATLLPPCTCWLLVVSSTCFLWSQCCARICVGHTTIGSHSRCTHVSNNMFFFVCNFFHIYVFLEFRLYSNVFHWFVKSHSLASRQLALLYWLYRLLLPGCSRQFYGPRS